MLMPRFQTDDAFYDDPAVARAGTAAIGLYYRCGVYVAKHLLDGHVPSEIASQYGTPEWTRKLTDAGLWETEPGGHYMPLYFAHGNPSREKVLADREMKSQRQQRWLEKQRNPSSEPRRVSRRVNRPSDETSRDGPRDAPLPPSPYGGGKGSPARAARGGAGGTPPNRPELRFEPHPFKPDANGATCDYCELPKTNSRAHPEVA